MRPVPDNALQRLHADPPSAYRQSLRHLRLPAAVPQAVSTAFAQAAEACQEAGALLYGVRGSQAGAPDVTHALVIPAQSGHRTYYRVPHDSIAAASAATRMFGWVTLGQLHSHPGQDVEHSWYDDRHAISIRTVSFVLPNYGRDPGDWPARIGVHEYQDGWWHLLTTEQSAVRISFVHVPLQVIDLRR
jgi:Prokaryotic homologs of the JAB domain